MKGAMIMLPEQREAIKRKLPVNDAKYIAFKSLKGILGRIDTDKVREEKVNEVIARYKCNT